MVSNVALLELDQLVLSHMLQLSYGVQKKAC